MKGGSSGFPDNTNYPRVTEAYLYVQRDTIILSLSYDSSDPWFKVETDFRYLYNHTHKAQNENVKIPSMKGLSGVTSMSFLLLNTLYSQNGAMRAVVVQVGHVPLKNPLYAATVTKNDGSHPMQTPCVNLKCGASVRP